MKNNYLLKFSLLLFVIFFLFSNVYSQGSSCDNALNNAIKLYNSRDYQSAKKAFEIGQKNCEDKKVFQEWIKKCEDQIKAPAKPETSDKQTPAKPVQQPKPGNTVNVGKQTNDKEFQNATLQVSKPSIEFNASKESKEINVTTNYVLWLWEFVSVTPPSWVVVKKNQTSLTVTCEENHSLRNRKDYLLVKAGNKTERIEIVQKGKKDLFPVVRNLLFSNLTSNSSTHTTTNIKYKGEKNSSGQRNGLGAQLWSNGDFCFGIFSNGECTNGIYIDGDMIRLDKKQANKYQVGNFYRSNLNGEGRTYSDEGMLTYKGEFSNDEPAYGDSYWFDNLHPEQRFDIIQDQFGYYIGETLYSEPHGKGIYIHINKDMWYGDWLNGTRYNGIEIKFDGTTKVGIDFEALDIRDIESPEEETSTEDTVD
jgi:hypothetical protein